VVSRPAPVECGQLRFYLLWHARAQADGRHAWLRRQISNVAKELNATGQVTMPDVMSQSI
jgi:hypothetical protein